MGRISKHPVLSIPVTEEVRFLFEGHEVIGRSGFSIAAALHEAGFNVHSHSLKKRNRSLECGIGKCGACEMLVDGRVRRICITPVDGVREVCEIPKDHIGEPLGVVSANPTVVYKVPVVIIGSGPAGLACRQQLNAAGIGAIVVDSQDKVGGQFLMQTHQFFFFEAEKKLGGLRGFDIANELVAGDETGIMLNSTVWDILEGNRVACKNIRTNEIYYIDCQYLVVATGAIPYMPPFENDDLPGVFTAAVVQKMMNQELCLLGKKVLTIGAGNIGYLTSYQLMQAGADVKAIVEAQPHEGGFPVQANRVRRLGIPILTSTLLLKAVPNAEGTGITGAVVAQGENFKPVPGTEQLIEDIDMINICTGLVPDNQLLTKGRDMFGHRCLGAGDAIRIGEGTSAVLRGTQVAYEILEDMGVKFNYDAYLKVSKAYIDSQQHPVRVLESPLMPDTERQTKPFVLADCLYGFACNPCAFSCPFGAITKSSTSTTPVIDYARCTGCMSCVTQCPGLAIFGYNQAKKQVFLPLEFALEKGTDVFLVDNQGQKLGQGTAVAIIEKPNKTNVVRVEVKTVPQDRFLQIRGLIPVDRYPEPLAISPASYTQEDHTFLCHCDDVTMDEVLSVIGDRRFISVTEIKHLTRLGMGACRGKRCLSRLKPILRAKGIELVGEPTPRAPLSSQISLGEMVRTDYKEVIVTNVRKLNRTVTRVSSFVAGGGIGGSALYRYLAEAKLAPVLINYGSGASWRNIAGGRPAFSLPELSDIAIHNKVLFEELQAYANIDYKPIHYVAFAHDEAMLKTLEASMAWQDARLLQPAEFQSEISPYFNAHCKRYLGALKTRDCWQATPGKTIDILRRIGTSQGGTILENCKLIDVTCEEGLYHILIKRHEGQYEEYQTPVFINALGPDAGEFAKKLGIETGLYPVKHQAFITRRLPMMGLNGQPLEMLIDRRRYRGMSAVYGQQLAETGQIIGCASPANDCVETDKDLSINSRDFLEIVSEVFVEWIPNLSAEAFQAAWAGYYVEPRMIIDPALGLFVGLRGQGFMLGQYLAKLYVDALQGKPVPEYFQRLALVGDGLLEKAFK